MTALGALLTVWQSATMSYASRFNEIDTGVGVPGGDKLAFGTTVNGASVSDTLTAATGSATLSSTGSSAPSREPIPIRSSISLLENTKTTREIMIAIAADYVAEFLVPNPRR